MPAVLYAINRPSNAGLTLREIQRRPPKSREHPWVAAFLKALTREDVAPLTLRGYRSDLGLFAAWYDGHPLEKLTASDLAHFRQYLGRERSMKPASINLASSKRCAASVVGRTRAADYAPTWPPN